MLVRACLVSLAYDLSLAYNLFVPLTKSIQNALMLSLEWRFRPP
jgi:hypothetical protein